jgi:hypothetical protein
MPHVNDFVTRNQQIAEKDKNWVLQKVAMNGYE